jgi:hypothetical protein
MKLSRKYFGLRLEEYWFDDAGYHASRAPLKALRTDHFIAGQDCMLPEKTLLIQLDRDERALQDAMAARTRHSIAWCERGVRAKLASNSDERSLFYRAYDDFARSRRLLRPDAAEELCLDIFLAFSPSNELLHAAAFIPFPQASRYRYRYSVSLQKSQANAYLIWKAIQHAKAAGFAQFDLGGIPATAAAGPLKGIFDFKAQFGGNSADGYLFLRGNNGFLRILLKSVAPILRNHRLLGGITAAMSHIVKKPDGGTGMDPEP